MESQYPDWLRRARSDGHGGGTLPSLVRGVPEPYVMHVPLDVSADAFTLTMRQSPDAGGDAALEFTTSVGAFDGTYTPVTFTPDPTQFAALPADGDADGLVELFFDILRTPSGGSARRFAAGNIFISGKVGGGA